MAAKEKAYNVCGIGVRFFCELPVDGAFQSTDEEEPIGSDHDVHGVPSSGSGGSDTDDSESPSTAFYVVNAEINSSLFPHRHSDHVCVRVLVRFSLVAANRMPSLHVCSNRFVKSSLYFVSFNRSTYIISFLTEAFVHESRVVFTRTAIKLLTLLLN